jgi:hypothetical protein
MELVRVGASAALHSNPNSPLVLVSTRSTSGPLWTDHVKHSRAEDEVLGPFYRWIAGVEQKDRLLNKARAEAAMASLD